MNSITLDGKDYTNDVSGLKTFELTLTENSNSTISFQYSENLTFKADAYRYIEQKFFTDKQSKKNEIQVQITIPSCNRTYDFTIKADSISENIPSDCNCTLSLIYRDANVDFYKYLNETLIECNGYEENGTFPKFYYSKSPNILSILGLIIFSILSPIIFILNAIPFVSRRIPSISDFQARISGVTGRYHPAIWIRDCLIYHCQKNNFKLSSASILDLEQYFHSCLLCCQFEEGLQSGIFNSDNSPALTIIQLLELLKDVFNADFKIKNNTLFFETKEELRKGLTTLVSIEDSRYESAPSYAITQDKDFAYARYEFANDAIDQQGNKVADLYKDIVEWNYDKNKWQEGEKTVSVNFSPVRFMFDKKSNRFFDNIRQNGGYTHNEMIMSGDTAANFKLLAWDGLNAQRASVVKRPIGDNKFDLNYPFYFNENYEEKELYQNFHYVDNPNLSNDRGIVVDEFEYLPTDFEKDLTLIENNRLDLLISTYYGSGKCEEIVVNFDTGTIKLKNISV